MKILILITLLVLSTLIMSCVRLTEPLLTEPPLTDEDSCIAADGKWVRTGMDGTFRCVHEYSDGGKSCNNSIECEGSCLVMRNGTSYCKHDNDPFGCYQSIEDYRNGIPPLCVD